MAYEDALVKGEPVLQMLGYVKKRRGMDGVNRVLGFTNEKHSTRYELDNFKEMEWYSMLHYDSMLEEMERVFPNDEDMFYKACSHFIENMGIMKYFVKFAMSPQQLLGKASKDFNKFYSAGSLRVENTKKKHVELILTDFPFSEHWNRSFAGFLEALCSYVTRADNVHCKIKMDYDKKGKEQCWFITDWE